MKKHPHLLVQMGMIFLKNAIENNIQQLRDIEIQMLSDG
jgi:hypothetical protein